jgi:hypothetical protein
LEAFLKKTVVFLSVLSLVAVFAFAGEEPAAAKVDVVKEKAAAEASVEAVKDTLQKKGATELQQSDAVVPAKPEHSCPAMKDAKAEETSAKKEGESAMAGCSMKKQNQELTDFHSAMHPIAMAVGFEGEGKADYAKVRELYPALKEKTEILAKMKCDGTCCKNSKAFIEQRTVLVKAVDDLGAACKGKDESKITPAFNTMHEGYIKLASLCK